MRALSTARGGGSQYSRASGNVGGIGNVQEKVQVGVFRGGTKKETKLDDGGSSSETSSLDRKTNETIDCTLPSIQYTSVFLRHG